MPMAWKAWFMVCRRSGHIGRSRQNLEKLFSVLIPRENWFASTMILSHTSACFPLCTFISAAKAPLAALRTKWRFIFPSNPHKTLSVDYGSTASSSRRQRASQGPAADCDEFIRSKRRFECRYMVLLYIVALQDVDRIQPHWSRVSAATRRWYRTKCLPFGDAKLRDESVCVCWPVNKDWGPRTTGTCQSRYRLWRTSVSQYRLGQQNNHR